MQNIFVTHMPLIYFIYGLAFFTLGLCLALHSRRDSDFVLSKSLWMLAAFGLIHSLAEWAKIYVPIDLQTDSISSHFMYHVAEAIVVTASFMFLFLFGVNLLSDSIKKFNQFKYVPLIIACIWLLKFVFWDLIVVGVDNIDRWTFYSTSIARYVLAFPGAIVTGIALLIQANILREFEMKSAGRYCTMAGIVFFLYSFFSGLIVLPVDFWPANILNTEMFVKVVGMPVQIFRASLGLVMALIMIRIINIFDEEQNQRLAQAKQQTIIIQERERFSRDLHDGLMQSIYSVGLVLDTSKLLLERGETETLAAHIEDSQNKLKKTNALLRNYIGNLPQLNKENQGLVELIETLGQEFKGLSMLNLKIKSNLDKDIILTPKQANYVNHIIKEALFNIIKHANASQVEIQVSTASHDSQQNINVLIIDDGKGFNLEAVRSNDAAENQGLINMKFRAQRLHGNFEVISGANIGTKLSLTFPISGIPQ